MGLQAYENGSPVEPVNPFAGKRRNLIILHFQPA